MDPLWAAGGWQKLITELIVGAQQKFAEQNDQ